MESPDPSSKQSPARSNSDRMSPQSAQPPKADGFNLPEPPKDLWQYFLSRLDPLHRDDMAAERTHIEGYKSKALNADAKLILNCFMVLVRRLDLLHEDILLATETFRSSQSSDIRYPVRPHPHETAVTETLATLAPKIDETNRILRVYQEMEALRILAGRATVIADPEKAAKEANTEALANRIAEIWARNTQEQECWYDHIVATIPIKGWIIGILLLTTPCLLLWHTLAG